LHRQRTFARSLFPLGALILIIVLFSPAGARAQQHPSARIEALGGDAISGIVPDTLTDIYLNPAYLHRCRRLTINYGQRKTEDFLMRFPRALYLNKRQLFRDTMNSSSLTEISLYGISVGPWRMGLSAAWQLDYEDDSIPEYTTYYWDNSISNRTENDLVHRDRHDYRFDISISHELSSTGSIGFRAGGYQRKYANKNTGERLTIDFMIEEDSNEITTESKSYYCDDTDDHKRVTSFYLQAGLLEGERSILLQAARHEIYSRNLSRDIISRTNYDEYSYPYRLSRDEVYYRDERSGVLWHYELRGRASLPFGIRLYAGGWFEHMTYDTDWFDRDHEYDWTEGWEYEEREERVSFEFDDEGDYKGFSLFLKAGRRAELRSDLKVTTGLHGYVRWMRSEENPIALVTVYSSVGPAFISFPIESQIRISTESTLAGLSLPLAIEYEPARWIAIWSGFRVYATYRKERDYLPHIGLGDLLNFLDPSSVASFLDRESPRSVDDVAIDSSASIGFSIHYRNKFFVDLYTGSDLTPDYISNYILDVRYAF
jgi:hypothetical protein